MPRRGRLLRSLRIRFGAVRTDFGGCREEGGADLHHAWTEAGALCGIPSRRLELCRCLFVAKRSSRTCAECRVKAIEATLGP